MKRVGSLIFIIALMVLGSHQPARAAFNMDNLSSPSGLINIVVLLCAVICLVWALKIMSLVRGGLISKSWQMFALGFSFLIMAQVIVVLQEAGFFSVPGYLTTALYLIMTITWLMGLYQTRKVLG
nr:hypothetical protein [candidate division Zixibacteria bacterium]